MMASLYPAPLAVDEVLELTGVGHFADQRTQKLSGGQTQRVRFAVALVSNPDLLVLDEPTAAMDVEGRHAFWTTMREFTADGRTVLFATHYLEEADALRRPHRADGPRRDRGRRAADRDQGDGRDADDPRHPARRRAGGARAAARRESRRAARRGGRARLQRLRRGDPRAARRPTPTPATSRSPAPASRRRSSRLTGGERRT